MRYSFASLWHASSQSTLHVQTCAGLPDSDSAYQGQQPVRQPLKDLIPNVQRSEQGSHPFAKTKQAPMLKFPAPANRWDPDAENGVENGDGGEGGKITARIRPPPSRTKRNGTASIFEEVTSTHGFVPSKSAFRKVLLDIITRDLTCSHSFCRARPRRQGVRQGSCHNRHPNPKQTHRIHHHRALLATRHRKAALWSMN